jgi:hypothetical protein
MTVKQDEVFDKEAGLFAAMSTPIRLAKSVRFAERFARKWPSVWM